MDEYRIRSTFRSPVSLSSSYLTLEPLGISMRAVNSSGTASPIGTSCQGWAILKAPFRDDGSALRRGLYMRVVGSRPGPLLPEVLQDGFVGLFVGHEHLRPVVQCGGVAPQLRAGQVAISAVQYEGSGERDCLPNTEVRVDVLVSGPEDGWHLGHRVPPERLPAQGGQQLLLVVYPVQVGPRRAPVAGVEEGFAAAEALHALAHVPLLGEHVVSHVYLHPAYDVYNLLEALEVHYYVVVHGDAREPLHHASRLVHAPVGVGGVDLVLHPGFDLDVEVARNGEQLYLPRGRRDANEHHGIRTRGAFPFRSRALID